MVKPVDSTKRSASLAERIREEYENEAFHPLDRPGSLHGTVSIEVAQYILQEELRPFLKRADSNMYHAKGQGGNRVFYRQK